MPRTKDSTINSRHRRPAASRYVALSVIAEVAICIMGRSGTTMTGTSADWTTAELTEPNCKPA